MLFGTDHLAKTAKFASDRGNLPLRLVASPVQTRPHTEGCSRTPTSRHPYRQLAIALGQLPVPLSRHAFKSKTKPVKSRPIVTSPQMSLYAIRGIAPRDRKRTLPIGVASLRWLKFKNLPESSPHMCNRSYSRPSSSSIRRRLPDRHFSADPAEKPACSPAKPSRASSDIGHQGRPLPIRFMRLRIIMLTFDSPNDAAIAHRGATMSETHQSALRLSWPSLNYLMSEPPAPPTADVDPHASAQTSDYDPNVASDM